MKASEAQGAENAPKSLQFSLIDCGDESIRRRNKRAARKKEIQKYAPFSYRKKHPSSLISQPVQISPERCEDFASGGVRISV